MMAKLLRELASKAAPNAIDARLKAEAERQGRAIDTALNVFSSPDRNASKGDDRRLASSSGRSAALTSGPGGVSIGMNGSSRPATKADAPLTDRHPNIRHLPLTDHGAGLATMLIERTAELPFGEPIAFGASDVAEALKISHAEADAAINELRRADLILPRSNGALGVLAGFVVAKELRR